MTYTTTYSDKSADTLPANIHAIIDDVCAALAISREMIYSGRRYKPIVAARRFVWKILKHKGFTYGGNGAIFGKDHTTVMCGLEQIEYDIRDLPHIRAAWNKVRHHITGIAGIKTITNEAFEEVRDDDNISDGTYLVILQYPNGQQRMEIIERFAAMWMGHAIEDNDCIVKAYSFISVELPLK